ncbi:MAG: hypothetical protein MZW92_31265 [Comamonadaceae bacterium]|nr:hypothetical protein [Comamonadaceae bacterium]
MTKMIDNFLSGSRRKSHQKKLHAGFMHPIASHPLLRAFGDRHGIADLLRPVKGVIALLQYVQPVPLEKVTSEQIDLGAKKALIDGKSPRYVGTMVASFKSFIRFCVAQGAMLQTSLLQGLSMLRYSSAISAADVVVVPKELIDVFTDYVYANGNDEDVVLWECVRTGARLSEPLFVRVKDVLYDSINDVVVLSLGTKTKVRKARQPKRATMAITRLVANRQPDELLLTLGHRTCQDLSTHDARRGFLQSRTIVARDRLYELQMECFGEVKFRPKNMRSSFISSAVSLRPESTALVAQHCGNSVETIVRFYLQPVGDPFGRLN